LLVTVLLGAGCFVPREPPPRAAPECTRCHGDATRAGTPLQQSAPPTDTFGNVERSFPGVGAHALHLAAGATHGPVACRQCHPVPEVTDSPGHNDGLTQVVLAARDGGVPASWVLAERTCSNSSCHGPVSGSWTRPRTSAEACGSCHAIPPPAPHPQYQDCGVCHGEVLRGDVFVAPDKHVDGTVQVAATTCASCHGSDDAGIPPRALDGGTRVAQSGVGAHTAHRTGGAWSRPVSCETCHEVPTTTAHPNGGLVEVKAAVAWNGGTGRCATSCHGVTSPAWTTEDAGLSCSSCHGAPPPSPHPAVSQCVLCHGPAVRAQHLDGVVQVNVPTACNGCHGSATNDAPPSDLSGSADTGRTGVGAHQSHLVSRGLARVVGCAECHVVPATVDAGAHLDGLTQVRFEGVARSNGASPVWNGLTCANSACHDTSVWRSSPGGGSSPAPAWTRVDGSQRTCTSCHGAPPPAPHVQRSDCFACHQSASPDGGFVRPDLHVNGRVDFVVP
jgi:predicted CxxxxCH...CXXCH cytochrome family protein